MKLHVSWHVLDMCTATWHVWDPSRSTQHPQKPLFWHLGHICSSNSSKVRAWPVFDKFHVYDTCAAQPRDRCVTYVDHLKILLKHLTCLCTWLYGHCMGVALNAIPLLKCSNLDPYWERVNKSNIWIKNNANIREGYQLPLHCHCLLILSIADRLPLTDCYCQNNSVVSLSISSLLNLY